MKKAYWIKTAPYPPFNEECSPYQCKNQIAETRSSVIFIGYLLENPSYKVIFKFIRRFEGSDEQIKREVYIMNNYKHPNLVKAEKYFEVDYYYCIVSKYAEHKDLYALMKKHYEKGIPEGIAKKVMLQLLDALSFLHKNGIWHRDIKPGNVFVYFWDHISEIIDVKLGDFGFSRHFEENELGTDFNIGTPEFCAPELANGYNYTNSVDIFALGISLFYILTGKMPYPSRESGNIFKETVKKARLKWSFLQEKKCSLEAIDLVTNMCLIDPSKRITAIDALNHTWLTKNTKATSIENEYRAYIQSEITHS